MAAPVNLGLADPVPERLVADVELAGDPHDLTVTLAGGLDRREHQGDRPLTHLGRVSLWKTYGCLPWLHPFQGLEPPQTPGRFADPLGRRMSPPARGRSFGDRPIHDVQASNGTT